MAKTGTVVKYKFKMRLFTWDIEVRLAPKYIYSDEDRFKFEVGDPLPERPELGAPMAIYWLVQPVDMIYAPYHHRRIREKAQQLLWPNGRPPTEYLVMIYVWEGGNSIDLYMRRGVIQIRKLTPDQLLSYAEIA